MKIRGDGRLGGISEVLGKRKWKEPRTWSSKWVTTGNGKVNKVKVVIEQRLRMGRPLIGTGGTTERGTEPRTKLLSESGTCAYAEGMNWRPRDVKIKVFGKKENSFVISRLRLCPFTVEGLGSILGWGTKILQATWCGYKTNKQNSEMIPEEWEW